MNESLYLREIEKRLEARPGGPSPGKLAIRRCSDDDLPGLLDLVRSVNWQVTAENLSAVMRYGEMWCLTGDGVIAGSAGWIPHGANCAWIVMVMTRPEWRKCSIATTLMLAVLEQTAQYPVRMLDASEYGEPVYRKLGFRECAKVPLVEVAPGTSPAPRFTWRPMRENDLPLPGTDELDPAHEHIFFSAPELCRVLERNGRVAAWFQGRYKGRSIHIGQIYAEDAIMAADAFYTARAMLPEHSLTLAVPQTERELHAAIQTAGAKPVRTHIRMYLADRPVPPFPPGIRGSAGPDLG